MKETDKKSRLEKDVISATAESHPIGTGIGAVGGTLAGAALGAALGPLGALTGAAIGSVAGAIAGRGIAAGIDPDAEIAYWQRRYREEPYYKSDYAFDDYGPAYGLGWRLYAPDSTFESIEPQLSESWEKERGDSRLPWHHAREAARASWDRVHANRKID